MATEIDGGVAGRDESEIISTVSCDIGSHRYFGPCAGGETGGTTKRCAHDGRVVVIDAALRPRIIADCADLVPGVRSAIGMDA